MRRVLIGLIVVAALFISGCSDEGILKLLNYSMDEIWYEVEGDFDELASGWEVSYSWDITTSIFGDDEKKVTVQYGGGYWFWNDYEVTKTVKPGKTTRIEIIGDAGEIEIENNSSSYYIVEVYLSPSSDPDWGDDDLIGDIWPNNSATWKVTTGYWDIKVVDDYWDVFLSFDNYVGPEETITFDYTGFKKSGSSVADKKANAAKYTELTEDKCEQRQ